MFPIVHDTVTGVLISSSVLPHPISGARNDRGSGSEKVGHYVSAYITISDGYNCLW